MEISWSITPQPMGQPGQCLVPKGRRRLRTVQAVRPAANSGSIGHPIGVLQRGCNFFPWTVLYKTSPQRLSASQQAVMGIWKREQREESEGPPTKLAKPPSDPNPVVVFIVRLLAAATVTDNRIALTKRASAQQDLPAVARPVVFDVVRLGRKWDKNNRVV